MVVFAYEIKIRWRKIMDLKQVYVLEIKEKKSDSKFKIEKKMINQIQLVSPFLARTETVIWQQI